MTAKKQWIAAIAITAAASFVGGSAPVNASTDVQQLDALFAGSHPESPARFRIVEERDRLVYGVSGHAAPRVGEITQMRTVEDAG